MAISDLLRHMIELRAHLQAAWQGVAYDGLNSAVASTSCQLEHKIVQCTASAIFFDFPGNDYFEPVVKAITRGDIDNVQENPFVHVFLAKRSQSDMSQVSETGYRHQRAALRSHVQSFDRFRGRLPKDEKWQAYEGHVEADQELGSWF